MALCFTSTLVSFPFANMLCPGGKGEGEIMGFRILRLGFRGYF